MLAFDHVIQSYFFLLPLVFLRFPTLKLLDFITILQRLVLWCHFREADVKLLHYRKADAKVLDSVIIWLFCCCCYFPEADANIRDYSGKKAKQYLKNSASSRAQRKQFLSYCGASGDLIITPRQSSGLPRGRGSGIVHLSMTETQIEDGWTLV